MGALATSRPLVIGEAAELPPAHRGFPDQTTPASVSVLSFSLSGQPEQAALSGLRAAHRGIRAWHCLKFMKI